MTEFSQFILTLNFEQWCKLMFTFFIIALLMAGIVEEIGAKWGNKK